MSAEVITEAADKIERLRAQVEHAHAILASEGAAWLVVGSNHEQSWRQSLTPAIQSYWDRYGNYFKKANPVDDFIAPIPAESLLPAPPVEPHDHKGHSEEKCIRCGWVMGHRPLNCMNDDTPHVFPSQLSEAADKIERLRAAGDALVTVMQAGSDAGWDAAIDAWQEADVTDDNAQLYQNRHSSAEEADRG